MLTIRENIKNLLKEIPEGVTLVAATKTRASGEILEAIGAGVTVVGENYVQEACKKYDDISCKVKWHLIGHLQKNKVKKAVEIFDVIETVDSFEIAELIDKKCKDAGKVIEVLVEINSGREAQKSGIFPEDAQDMLRKIAIFKNIKVAGLMTMGPFSGDPEDARPYFKETKKVFDLLRNADITGCDMEILSMGMTNSYRVAIEEGANMIRIGTKIFGERT